MVDFWQTKTYERHITGCQTPVDPSQDLSTGVGDLLEHMNENKRASKVRKRRTIENSDEKWRGEKVKMWPDVCSLRFTV